MTDSLSLLTANRSATTLLVLFIPSKDRSNPEIDQAYWVDEALRMLGICFRGATAFPQGKGVWRDDAQGGKLLFDEPVVIQCYTNEAEVETHATQLKSFLLRMGSETKQGAIGFVIDRDYLEIEFPLEEKRANGGTAAGG